MSQYATKSTLDGLYKEVYADGITNLVPESAILYKKIPFVGKDKQNGKYYNQPAILTNEAGFTYNADGSSFSLNNHITMTMDNCQVPGYEMLLRSGMSYQAAKAASKGKKAFVEGTSLIFENMLESMTKRLEIGMLYGRGHIGLTDESTTATTTPTATTAVLTIKDGEWASGIWAGAENSQVVIYANSALVSSGDDSIFSVTAVDADNKTITLTGTATGVSALDTALASYDLYVYFYGAKDYSMYSIKEQIQATTSLFGINPSTYNLFKGNSVSTSGQATFAKVQAWVNKAVSRGLNEKVIVLCNPATWADLNADLSALRSLDSSYENKGKVGHDSIEYISSNGKMEIIPHLFCKEGDMFILPEKRIKRVGECDVDFMSAASGDGRIFFDLPSNAGVEMRCYSSQAVFLEQPAKCVYISGIQNSI